MAKQIGEDTKVTLDLKTIGMLLAGAAEGDQWWDYQAGANFGWKISKSLGIFADTEYTRMWDSKMFITSFGLNYTFR